MISKYFKKIVCSLLVISTICLLLPSNAKAFSENYMEWYLHEAPPAGCKAIYGSKDNYYYSPDGKLTMIQHWYDQTDYINTCIFSYNNDGRLELLTYNYGNSNDNTYTSLIYNNGLLTDIITNGNGYSSSEKVYCDQKGNIIAVYDPDYGMNHFDLCYDENNRIIYFANNMEVPPVGYKYDDKGKLVLKTVCGLDCDDAYVYNHDANGNIQSIEISLAASCNSESSAVYEFRSNYINNIYDTSEHFKFKKVYHYDKDGRISSITSEYNDKIFETTTYEYY